MKQSCHKIVFASLLPLFLIVAIGHQPAHAIDKSRLLIGLLFFSGLGCSTAGAVMKEDANEIYDDYLHTAVRVDMERLIEDYDERKQQSLTATRVGAGLVIGAVLLSLIDAAYIPPLEAEADPDTFSFDANASHAKMFSIQVQNSEICLLMGCGF